MGEFKKIVAKLSPAQLIISYYFLAVSISTILLSLPFAIKQGVKWTFSDALFTAVSAVSVTGLTVVNISEVFTIPGYFIVNVCSPNWWNRNHDSWNILLAISR